jgi:anti-sigma B factor antagonist
MEVQVQEYDGVTIMGISGEIDGSTAAVLQEQVSVVVAFPECRLLLDMSEVSFMSSAGLRVMLLVHRQVTNGNGQVVLVGLSDALKDTMDATGFLKYFTVTDDVDSGLEFLRQ